MPLYVFCSHGQTKHEVKCMAKQGMKRPDVTKLHPKNDLPPVPELQGTSKRTKAKANPIIADGSEYPNKVFHKKSFFLYC